MHNSPWGLLLATLALTAFALGAKPLRGASKPADGAHAPALRSIALDPQKPKAVYKLSAAPGLATVVELPEPWAVTPTCGDCVYGEEAPKGQLFRIDTFPQTHSFSLKPTRLPSAETPPSAFVTNVDVTLAGGISVTFFVELTLPEHADARVELTLPESETGKARQTAQERKLEGEFDARVEKAARDMTLKAASSGTTCKDFLGAPHRRDGLVVRLKQLCRNDTLLWAVCEIENRNRSDVAIEDVSLSSEDGESSAESYVEKRLLRFNERAKAVAGIAMPGEDVRPTKYEVKVTEAGGASREVVIEGIDF